MGRSGSRASCSARAHRSRDRVRQSSDSKDHSRMMLNGDGMFLMAVGVMRWLEVVGAFTLEPYRVHKHPWRVNKVGQGDRKWLSDSVVDSRFNQSARVAWLPRGSDATSGSAGSAASAAGARVKTRASAGRGVHRAQPAWTHLVRPEHYTPATHGEPLSQ